jgi:hypothetical protein
MKKGNLLLSYILILSGLLLISNFSVSKITGNVIGEKIAIGTSPLGFVFLILGIVLFVIAQETRPEKTLAQKVKESGKFVDNPNEIIKIARKSGYRIGEEVKEGTRVYDSNGKYITVIPRRHISPGTYHGIIKELAQGKSTFTGRGNF